MIVSVTKETIDAKHVASLIHKAPIHVHVPGGSIQDRRLNRNGLRVALEHARAEKIPTIELLIDTSLFYFTANDPVYANDWSKLTTDPAQAARPVVAPAALASAPTIGTNAIAAAVSRTVAADLPPLFFAFLGAMMDGSNDSTTDSEDTSANSPDQNGAAMTPPRVSTIAPPVQASTYNYSLATRDEEQPRISKRAKREQDQQKTASQVRGEQKTQQDRTAGEVTLNGDGSEQQASQRDGRHAPKAMCTYKPNIMQLSAPAPQPHRSTTIEVRIKPIHSLSLIPLPYLT